FFTQGVWAIVVYRFGSWVNRKVKIPLVRQIFILIYFFLNKFVEITTGISISSNAKIGKGLYIGHFGLIFIHNDVEIGENCSIAQGVTIGSLGLGKEGVPKIGNNVFIGSGAKVLGPITIGNNVRIGANAVVIKDVPDNATVVGVPARVVKINR
ncbi:MAG: serine O-acetyltransferase, partial [Candidatus Jordarchaeaceae archaeon]